MTDMLQSFSDPHARHAMLVHWPVVLGLLGIVPMLAHLALKCRYKWLAIVCIVWFGLMSVVCGQAAGAGEEAYDRVSTFSNPPITATEHQAMEKHEELGEGAWMWPGALAVLAGLTLIPKKPVRIGAGVLGVLAAGGVAVWVVLTAHSGGDLVYRHGLGVPPRLENSLTNPAADAPSGARGEHAEGDHD